MSLKAFHVFFISLSCLLCFGCGGWELKTGFSPDGSQKDILIGGGAILAGLGLIVYEWMFLKKTRNVSFL
jgi:hypothetical protein